MKKKKDEFASVIDFKEQTPDMQIEKITPDPLYEKAFLSPKAETDSQINTTPWD